MVGGPYTNEADSAEKLWNTCLYIESPHEKGHIWTGSDDGFGALDQKTEVNHGKNCDA